MSRTADFGVAQFHRLLPGAAASALAAQLAFALPGLVIGNLFGEQALAAYQVVSPWIYAVSFLLVLLSKGTALNYGLAMGACDRARCRTIFSSGFFVALTLGVLLSALSLLVSTRTASQVDLTAEMARTMAACWRGFAAVFLVFPISVYVRTLVCTDGDSFITASAVGCELVVSLCAMILLGRVFGLSGAILGLAFGMLAGLAVAAVHFFKETNSLRLGPTFSPREIAFGCASEFPEASASLFFAIMIFIATLVWQNYIGLASLGVVSVIFGLDALFAEDAFPSAAQPLVNVCLGDGNSLAARRVLHAASRISFVCGLGYCLVLELFPRQILGLYGITSPELLAVGVPSLRIAALNYPLVGLVGLLINHYQVIRRFGLSQLLVFLRCGFFPVMLMTILTPCFGLVGFWCGYASMCLGAILGLWILLVLRGRAEGFPFFLPSDPVNLRTWCVVASEENAVLVSQEVYAELQSRGATPQTVGRASVLAEEAVMAVVDRNPDRRVLVELMLRLDEHIEIVLRDDGRIFNMSAEAEAPTSIRAFVLDGMLSVSARRDEFVTTGFNRRVYSVRT